MSTSASQRTIQRLAPWALPILLLAIWQLSVSANLCASMNAGF